MTALCSTCGQPFEAKQKHGRFCSSACRQKSYRDRVTQHASVTHAEPPERVTQADIDRLDAIGARIQRGDVLTVAEAESAEALCERVLESGCEPEDEYLAHAILARLPEKQTAGGHYPSPPAVRFFQPCADRKEAASERTTSTSRRTR